MKKALIYSICGLCLAAGIVFGGIALASSSGGTFRSVVNAALFAELPLMKGENIHYSDVEDVGDENYLLCAYDTSLEEYKAYLALLEKNKFTKRVDNGENGIEGYVYTAHYQKGDLLAVVTYLAKMRETMITLCKNTSMSDHLFYSDEYVKSDIPGAKTTLTQMELASAGNSFVFQLKNGHFVLNDGGTPENLRPLLDYLEQKAPNGEKPVVEAWIVSHAHMDHMGVLYELTNHPELGERISVEEMYFTEACDGANEERNGTTMMFATTANVKIACAVLKTSSGEATPMYRLRTGERYYFDDITMDVVYTQDILNYKEWTTSNAQSSVLMYTIEGQKVFITADTDYECQMKMLEMYDDDYFNLTLYQPPHHNGNIFDQFTQHIQAKTLMCELLKEHEGPSGMISRYAQFLNLIAQVEEHFAFGEGGVVYTFPYEVGTSERLPLVDWTMYVVGAQ